MTTYCRQLTHASWQRCQQEIDKHYYVISMDSMSLSLIKCGLDSLVSRGDGYICSHNCQLFDGRVVPGYNHRHRSRRQGKASKPHSDRVLSCRSSRA